MDSRTRHLMDDKVRWHSTCKHGMGHPPPPPLCAGQTPFACHPRKGGGGLVEGGGGIGRSMTKLQAWYTKGGAAHQGALVEVSTKLLPWYTKGVATKEGGLGRSTNQASGLVPQGGCCTPRGFG